MNKPEMRRARNWQRLSGVFLLIVTMIWLSTEESSEIGVLLISSLLCTWGGFWLLRRIGYAGRNRIFRHMITGTGVGLLLAPMAIFLMALKTGIHGHGTPDFTAAQMQAVLARTPYFVIGGLLLGVGSGLLSSLQKDQIAEGS